MILRFRKRKSTAVPYICNAYMFTVVTHLEKPLDLLAFRRNVVCVYLMHVVRHAQPAKTGPLWWPQPLCRRVPGKIQCYRQGHFFADAAHQSRCLNCGKDTRERGVDLQSVILDFICSALMNMREMPETISVTVITQFDHLVINLNEK